MPKDFEKSEKVRDVSEVEQWDLSIFLPFRNQKMLDKYLLDIQNPKSPLFRHYLSPKEFDAKFRPTQSDYQTLVDFVKSHGLTVTAVSPNRMALGVSGTVKNIQEIFHVQFHFYRLPNGVEFRSPDREPSIDLDVQLSGIDGLVNFGPPKPPGFNRKNLNLESQPIPSIGSGQDGSFIGNDFRTENKGVRPP